MAFNIGNDPSKITGYGGGILNSFVEGENRRVYMQVEQTAKGDEHWTFIPDNKMYSGKIKEQFTKFSEKSSSVEPEWRTVDFRKFGAIDADGKEWILAVVGRALTTSGSLDYVVEELDFDGSPGNDQNWDDDSRGSQSVDISDSIDEGMIVLTQENDESGDNFYLPDPAVNAVDAQSLRDWMLSFRDGTVSLPGDEVIPTNNKT